MFPALLVALLLALVAAPTAYAAPAVSTATGDEALYPAEEGALATGSAVVTASEPGELTVVVRDSGGDAVRTVLPGRSVPAGNTGFEWDGTDDLGADLPAGVYTWTAELANGGGTASTTGRWQIDTRTIATVVSPAPDDVISGADVKLTVSPLQVAIDRVDWTANRCRSYWWGCHLGFTDVNLGGRLTYTLDSDRLPPGQVGLWPTVAWTDPLGARQSKNLPLVNVTVANAPRVTDGSTQHAFSPNGDGFEDTIGLLVWADQALSATAEILDDATGETLVTLPAFTAQADRAGGVAWDGKIGESTAPAGRYRYRISVTGQYGHKTTVGGLIGIDSRTPATFHSPEEGATVRGVVPFVVRRAEVPALDNVGFSAAPCRTWPYYCPGGNGSTSDDLEWQYTWDTHAMPDGPVDVNAAVYWRDILGVAHGRSYTRRVIVDNPGTLSTHVGRKRFHVPSDGNPYVGYAVSRTSKITVRVRDAQDAVVTTPLDGVETSAWSTASWVPSDATPDGTYTFEVVAEENGRTHRATHPFVLDRQAVGVLEAPASDAVLQGADTAEVVFAPAAGRQVDSLHATAPCDTWPYRCDVALTTERGSDGKLRGTFVPDQKLLRDGPTSIAWSVVWTDPEGEQHGTHGSVPVTVRRSPPPWSAAFHVPDAVVGAGQNIGISSSSSRPAVHRIELRSAAGETVRVLRGSDEPTTSVGIDFDGRTAADAPLPAGTYTVWLRASAEGVEPVEETRTIEIDHRPLGTLDLPAEGDTLAGDAEQLVFRPTPGTGATVTRVRLCDQGLPWYSQCSVAEVFGGPVDGAYRTTFDTRYATGDRTLILRVDYKDRRGTTREAAFERHVTIDNSGPKVVFEPTADRGQAPFTTGYRLRATSPNAGDLTYTLAWDDGSEAATGELVNDAGAVAHVVEHEWKRSGVHRATVTVRDAAGKTAKRSVLVDVTRPPNRAPTASLALSDSTGAVTPVTVTATVNGADPDEIEGQQLTWRIDWGDGTSPDSGALGGGTAASQQHTFTKPGRYTITASVSDGITEAKATREIDVFAYEPPALTVTARPAAVSRFAAATIGFEVDPATTPVTCAIDGAEAKPCTSPLELRDLSDGQHEVVVEARDPRPDGGFDTETVRWLVDRTGPSVAITRPAEGARVAAGDVVVAGRAGDDLGDAAAIDVVLHEGGQPTGAVVSDGSATRDGRSWERAFRLAPGTYTAVAKQADARGNRSSSVPLTFVVAADPPPPLTVSAGEPIRVTAGQQVELSASASRPGASLRWSFSDGAPEQPGAIARRTMADAGEVVATVTARDGEDVATATQRIVVEPRPADAAAGVRIHVRRAGAVVPGVQVLWQDPASGARRQALSGDAGDATLELPPGRHTVMAYKAGYRPAQAPVVVAADGTGEATIELTAGEAVSSTVESRELSADELPGKGIDPTAPGNGHVVEFRAELVFGELVMPGLDEQVEVVVHVNEDGRATGTTTVSDGGSGSTGTACTGNVCTTPGGGTLTVDVIDGHPIVQALQITGRAHMLKQFFEIRHAVFNLSDDPFTLEGGESTIDLPAGLSVASGAVAQRLGVIRRGEPGVAEWVVRGDAAGSYRPSVAFAGRLEPFAAPVSTSARLSEPIRVWKPADALDLDFRAETERLVPGRPYRIGYRATNRADTPIYNVLIETDRDAAGRFQFQPRDNGVRRIARIGPGESVDARDVTLVPSVASTGSLNLKESTFAAVAGEDVPAEGVIGMTAPYHGVPDAKALTQKAFELRWPDVPGATEFRVHRSPDLTKPWPSSAERVYPSLAGLVEKQGDVVSLGPDARVAYVTPPDTGAAWYAVTATVPDAEGDGEQDVELRLSAVRVSTADAAYPKVELSADQIDCKGGTGFLSYKVTSVLPATSVVIQQGHSAPSTIKLDPDRAKDGPQGAKVWTGTLYVDIRSDKGGVIVAGVAATEAGPGREVLTPLCPGFGIDEAEAAPKPGTEPPPQPIGTGAPPTRSPKCTSGAAEGTPIPGVRLRAACVVPVPGGIAFVGARIRAMGLDLRPVDREYCVRAPGCAALLKAQEARLTPAERAWRTKVPKQVKQASGGQFELNPNVDGAIVVSPKGRLTSIGPMMVSVAGLRVALGYVDIGIKDGSAQLPAAQGEIYGLQSKGTLGLNFDDTGVMLLASTEIPGLKGVELAAQVHFRDDDIGRVDAFRATAAKDKVKIGELIELSELELGVVYQESGKATAPKTKTDTPLDELPGQLLYTVRGKAQLSFPETSRILRVISGVKGSATFVRNATEDRWERASVSIDFLRDTPAAKLKQFQDLFSRGVKLTSLGFGADFARQGKFDLGHPKSVTGKLGLQSGSVSIPLIGATEDLALMSLDVEGSYNLETEGFRGQGQLGVLKQPAGTIQATWLRDASEVDLSGGVKLIVPGLELAVRGTGWGWLKTDDAKSRFAATGELSFGRLEGVGGDFVLTNDGFSACADLAGWRPSLRMRFGRQPDLSSGCDHEPIDVAYPGRDLFETAKRFVPKAAAASGASAAPAGAIGINIPRGQRSTTLRFDGRAGAPALTLTAPGGRTLDLDPAGGSSLTRDALVIRADKLGQTLVQLRAPAAGLWVATPKPDSPAVVRVGRSLFAPPPKIASSVRFRRDGRAVVSWAIRGLAGRKVTFVEREGSRGGSELFTTGRARGSRVVSVRPGRRALRRLGADVVVDGQAVEQIAVGRFMYPGPPRAGAARALRAVSRGRGAVRVSWQPGLNASRSEVRLVDRFGVRRSATVSGSARGASFAQVNAGPARIEVQTYDRLGRPGPVRRVRVTVR